MTVGRIIVGTDTLLVGGENVWTALGEVENSLGTLRQLVASFENIWIGLGHQDFQGYFAQWHSIASTFAGDLGRLQRLLETAHGNYHGAETANLAMWNKR